MSNHNWPKILGILHFEYYQAATIFLPTLPPTGLGLTILHHCSGVHIRIDKPCFMKQMAYFWPSLVGNKNAITPSCSGSTLVLIVALKWGTVWTSISIGTGIMKSQT